MHKIVNYIKSVGGGLNVKSVRRLTSVVVMSTLLISSASFASGDPQTFPSSRGTIQYGNDVYISADDTNTLNQMLTGYTTNTSEAVEDALIAKNGTPYLASMSQQLNTVASQLSNVTQSLNQLAAIPERLDQITAAQDELAEAISEIQVSGGGGSGGAGMLQEGGVPISITVKGNQSYTTVGFQYVRNGKTWTDTSTGATIEVITIYADAGTDVQLVSYGGTSTTWSMQSSDTSLVLNVEGSSDRVGFTAPREWGGFTLQMGNKTATFSNGFGGLYQQEINKIKYGQLITVKFDANGGTGTMEDQQEAIGTTVKLSKCKYTNGDMTFMGWSRTRMEPDPFILGDKDPHRQVAYKDNVTFNFTNSENGTTLYAVWGYTMVNADSISLSRDTLSWYNGGTYIDSDGYSQADTSWEYVGSSFSPVKIQCYGFNKEYNLYDYLNENAVAYSGAKYQYSEYSKSIWVHGIKRVSVSFGVCDVALPTYASNVKGLVFEKQQGKQGSISLRQQAVNPSTGEAYTPGIVYVGTSYGLKPSYKARVTGTASNYTTSVVQ